MCIIERRVDVGNDDSPARAYLHSRRPPNPGEGRLSVVPSRRQIRSIKNDALNGVKLLDPEVRLPGLDTKKNAQLPPTAPGLPPEINSGWEFGPADVRA